MRVENVHTSWSSAFLDLYVATRMMWNTHTDVNGDQCQWGQPAFLPESMASIVSLRNAVCASSGNCLRFFWGALALAALLFGNRLARPASARWRLNRRRLRTKCFRARQKIDGDSE